MQTHNVSETVEGASTMSPAESVERVPKVRLDVLASRLLNDQDLGDLSSSSSLSSPSFSTADTTAVASSNVMPRMPLSVLVRAETQLKRPVPLSHGGLTINLSKEEIRHITDPEVLRYLASGDSADAPPHSWTPPPPSSSGTANPDIEAHIEALQKEIDTFITAVDNEGRSYEIRIGASGHKEMLIEDEEPDAAPEEDKDKGEKVKEGTAEAIAAEPPAPPSAPENVLVSSAQPTTGKAGPAPVKPSPALPRKSSTPTLPKQQKRPGTEKSARVRTRTQHTASPSPPPQQSFSRAKTSTQPSVTPVRSHEGLTEAEQSKVEQLLDGEAFATLTTSNPFTCGRELIEQLNELDEKIRCYVAVRGGQQVPSTLGRLPEAEEAAACNLHDDTPAAGANAAKTAVELGNAYMRDARQTEQAAQRLRSVNERLRALQRRNEALALTPSNDTPADILALRPSWAQPPSAFVEEAEVQQLLAAARAEEVRAREAGLTTRAPPPTTDPYVGLRSQLKDASSRAEEALKMYCASPPALRSTPSPLGEDAEESAKDV